MSRTLNDLPSANRGCPPKGEYVSTITGAISGRSKTKKTPQIELTISNGDFDFSDTLFVTEKTISRLALVAKRVANMKEDYELPDDDLECANELAKYIMQNIIGKRCVVVIEENEESFIPERGPDMGRKITKIRRRVAFNGYKELPATEGDAGGDDIDIPDRGPDNLPF